MPARSHVREALAEVAGVVRDERQIAHAALDDAADQRLGVARQAEAADHDRHAVAQRRERLGDRRDDLVRVSAGHAYAAPNAATAASPKARTPVTSSSSVMHSGGAKIAVPRLPSTWSDSLRAASSVPSAATRVERRLDLERAEQAERAHERRRARRRAATASSSRRSTGPSARGVLVQLLVLVDLQRLERGGARGRVRVVREAAREHVLVEVLRDALVHDHRADRRVARGEALRDGDQVGRRRPSAGSRTACRCGRSR